jgi:ATP-dependent DNA ligase
MCVGPDFEAATGFVPPCIPKRASKPSAGPDWIHEIKRDGYRLQVRRFGDSVRLFTRRGLARLLGKRRAGIVLSAYTDEDGATIFQQACKMGLEGIVSKRLSAPYRSGPSRNWLKVKNPDSPAMIRAREAEW